MLPHYPTYIKKPEKNIPLTFEEFDKLSYIGLANYMLHYPISIRDCKENKKLVLYCHAWKANIYHCYPRFVEVIPGLIYSSAELGMFDIPYDTKLSKTIFKYFKHLFFKDHQNE